MAKALPLRNQQKMVDTILRAQGTTLEAFLTEHVEAGASFELIGQELYATTDRAVSVSYNTVKRWLQDFGLLEVAS